MAVRKTSLHQKAKRKTTKAENLICLFCLISNSRFKVKRNTYFFCYEINMDKIRIT